VLINSNRAIETSVNFDVTRIWCEVVIALSRNTNYTLAAMANKKENITHKLLTLDCIDQPVYRTRKLIELRRTRTTPL
jgi:hypothetical protein